MRLISARSGQAYSSIMDRRFPFPFIRERVVAVTLPGSTPKLNCEIVCAIVDTSAACADWSGV
eukprot:9512220-Lingulodinium_polyedra.AAC.1